MDEQILRAVRDTRSEWNDLLEAQEAADLEQWLSEAISGDQETVRQATNRALDLLQAHPPAHARVSAELGIKGGLESLRLYVQPAGEHTPPPGTLMVCPVDPAHYRKRLRQKGQKLTCPDHNVPLVPEDSVETEA